MYRTIRHFFSRNTLPLMKRTASCFTLSLTLGHTHYKLIAVQRSKRRRLRRNYIFHLILSPDKLLSPAHSESVIVCECLSLSPFYEHFVSFRAVYSLVSLCPQNTQVTGEAKKNDETVKKWNDFSSTLFSTSVL